MIKQLIETRNDRHGNECSISKVKTGGIFCEQAFTVSYKGSARYWANKKNGSPYFDTIQSARAKVDRN